MSDIEATELLQQIPVSLFCKRIDKDEAYANPACLALFGARHNDPDFLSSLSFYDAVSRAPMTGEAHPYQRCADDLSVSLIVRVKSNARNITCAIEGSLVEIGNERWVVLHVSSVQDNDVSTFHAANSPLANHLAFNRLLSNISSQLINVSTTSLDSLIERSLGAFGEFCGVDRCYLFQFSDDKTVMDNTHEWVAAGVPPYKDDLQNVSLSDLPYFERVIKQQHVFKIDDVDQLPEEAALEKAEFARERIRSVLCVAVHLNEDLFGFVGCDIVGSAYIWRDHDVRYLKLIGEILSNTLENVANRLSLQQMQSQLEKANRRLEHLANSDGLTGIANRRQFDESLKKVIQRGTRECKSVSLLMVDVDHFKRFNDTFGHAAGDEALKQVAHALNACCKRVDDLAARYGGEEFAVILAETNEAQAHIVADEIMQAVASLGITFGNSSDTEPLTISIGISTAVCQSSLTLSELVTHADKALYQAKAGGRNQVAVL